MNPDDQKANRRESGFTDDQVRLSLTEITAQFEPMTITVGDLFASEEELVYIPLSSTLYTGALAGIGFLVGGITGGITSILSNAQNIEYARDQAKVARQADFGVSLERRIQLHKGVAIPRSSIDSIETLNKGHGLRITHKGGLLDLGADQADESCRKLNAWREGKLEADWNTQGANLGLPSASTLLLWFMDGSVSKKIPEQGLSEILSEQDYLEELLKEFDLKQYSKKVAILQTAQGLPERWATVFREYLEAARAKGQRRIRWGIAVVCIGVLGISYYILSLVAGRPSDGPCIAGFVIILLSVPWLLMTIYSHSKTGKLVSLCKGSGRNTSEPTR